LEKVYSVVVVVCERLIIVLPSHCGGSHLTVEDLISLWRISEDLESGERV
jgi:hypothetical protein